MKMYSEGSPLLPLLLVVLVASSLLLLQRLRRHRFRVFGSGSNTVPFRFEEGMILLDASVGGEECLFMLDTGYAGAPVLNMEYIGRGKRGQRVREAVEGIRKAGKGKEEASARRLFDFVTRNSCMSYTSGCTMRLLGIGVTSEKQSDLFMCPPILFSSPRAGSSRVSPRQGAGLPEADVLVTNDLGASVHILTVDYLLQLSPVVVDNSEDCIHFSAPSSLGVGFHSPTSSMSGGSFLAEIQIEGTRFLCTVDTGSAGTVSLGSDAVSKLRRCERTGAQARQLGVNGEKICSDVLLCDVSFSGSRFPSLPILANNHPSGDVDGYIGTGLLRLFDLLFTDSSLLFRRNARSEDETIQTSHFSEGTCVPTLPCEK